MQKFAKIQKIAQKMLKTREKPKISTAVKK